MVLIAGEADAATYMTDGLATICLAGNWNAGILTEAITTATGDPSKVYASLPPFDTEEVTWISNSPEDAFCVTVDPNRAPAEHEAVELFFNWVFEAENFSLIQIARGTVLVTTNMTAEYTVLADCMLPVAEVMGSAPAVLMGFNLWAAEFRDAACARIKGLVSGDNDDTALVDKMVEMMPKSYKNQG